MQGANNKEKFLPFDASSYRVGIVVAAFNADITSAMLMEVKKTLATYKVLEENIFVMDVPGSVEIPLVAQTMALTRKYDCLITLGAVIRGETAHFDYVAKFVTEGVLRVQLDEKIPIGFGVLTTENLKQAQERVHVGGDATRAAMHVARAMKEIY